MRVCEYCEKPAKDDETLCSGCGAVLPKKEEVIKKEVVKPVEPEIQEVKKPTNQAPVKEEKKSNINFTAVIVGIVIFAVVVILISNLTVKDTIVTTSNTSEATQEVPTTNTEGLVPIELVISKQYEHLIDHHLKMYTNSEAVYYYDYDDEEGVVYLQLPQEEIDRVVAFLQEVIESNSKAYKDAGYINDVQIGSSGQLLNIDFTNNIDNSRKSDILESYSMWLMYLQAFQGVRADDMGISVTIKIDGQDFNHLVINKEFLRQEQ